MRDPVLFEGGNLISRTFNANEDYKSVKTVYLDGEDVTDRCARFCGSQLAGWDRDGWVELIKETSDGGILLASDGLGPYIERLEGVVKWERYDARCSGL